MKIFQNLNLGSQTELIEIADIGLRQSDQVMYDCSTSKLLCFLCIIGDFYELLFRPGIHVLQQSQTAGQRKVIESE